MTGEGSVNGEGDMWKEWNDFYQEHFRRQRIEKNGIARPALLRRIVGAHAAGQSAPISLIDDVAEETGLDRRDVSIAFDAMLRKEEISIVNELERWDVVFHASRAASEQP